MHLGRELLKLVAGGIYLFLWVCGVGLVLVAFGIACHFLIPSLSPRISLVVAIAIICYLVHLYDKRGRDKRGRFS